MCRDPSRRVTWANRQRRLPTRPKRSPRASRRRRRRPPRGLFERRHGSRRVSSSWSPCRCLPRGGRRPLLRRLLRRRARPRLRSARRSDRRFPCTPLTQAPPRSSRAAFSSASSQNPIPITTPPPVRPRVGVIVSPVVAAAGSCFAPPVRNSAAPAATSAPPATKPMTEIVPSVTADE